MGTVGVECRVGPQPPLLSSPHPAWIQWMEMKTRADRVIFCLGEDAPHWDQNQFSPVIFWSHLCISPTQNSDDGGENESVGIKIFETEQRAWSSAGGMASQLVEQCGGLLKIRKKRQPPDAHWMCCRQSVKTREADLWIESATWQLYYCTLVVLESIALSNCHELHRAGTQYNGLAMDISSFRHFFSCVSYQRLLHQTKRAAAGTKSRTNFYFLCGVFIHSPSLVPAIG